VKKVYLAGPMRGYEDYNYPAFHMAAAQLREIGYEVLNPAEFFDGDQSLPVEQYLKYDVEQVCTVDAMFVLPGWQESHGARLEVSIARALNKGVYSYPDGKRIQDTDLPVELEAATHVYGERQAAYGHPATDFERTGRIWGAILGIPDVPPELVALCMAGLKISREVNAPKRDNLVDLIGYAICAHRVVEAA
jgi:hypothetical protein